MKSMVAANIIMHTGHNGGGSFTQDGEAVAFTDGYMVGGVVPSLVIKTDNRVWFHEIVAQVQQFAWDHAKLLAQPGYFLGTWKSGDLLYLDVSQRIEDGAEALALAVSRKELAIWDNANACEVSCLPAIQALRDLLGNGI